MLRFTRTPRFSPINCFGLRRLCTALKLKVPAIPRDKLEISFSRSSGPGGQNVNKLNTQAEIRFSVHSADWLGEELKERILEVHSTRLTKNGELFVVSSKERTQEANLRDCFTRLKELLEEASWLPKERIATVAPEWTKESRLEDKKRRSKIKSMRRVNRDDW